MAIRVCRSAWRLLAADPRTLFGSSATGSVTARLIVPTSRSVDDGCGALADGSRLVRAIERTFELCAVAWRASFMRRHLDEMVEFEADRPAARVRLCGWVLIAATATHVGLVGLTSAIARWSGLGWFGVALLAVMCVRRPEAVIAAWARSRLSRLW